MKYIKNLQKIALGCLCLALVIFSVYLSKNLEITNQGISLSSHTEQTQETFEAYMNTLFRQEVSSNTINLHYTLKNPQNYGITEYPITYGEVSRKSHQEALAVLENVNAVLEKIPVSKLDAKSQLTYDILKADIETELAGKEFYLYQEILRPSTGIQAELPVLMAEYTFYNERDISDYLTLLQQTPDYFKQILQFELEKAKAGLFMPAYVAEDVLQQCSSFIADKENNYLLDTFCDKVNAMEGLTDQQRQGYIEENQKIVAESVIPAYEQLIQGMEKLKEYGKNQQGLCHLPQGRAYYEYLVKAYTGSDMTIEEMQTATIHQRAADMTEAARLIAENPKLLAQSASYSFSQQEPLAILQELQEKMTEDFPKAPDTSFSIKYVHPSLEEHMAPAFYLAVPIDDISQNSIYINGGSGYQKLKLYTTLAHEGFPGHLYQNIMERSQDYPAIRSLLGTSGYSEGWATYVEMISYKYAELEPALASLLQKDQSALLSLYATADMGIHGDGWSMIDMKEFFGEYQITDEGALTEIYQLIVAEPAHYLKYYIGYLEFLNLKDYAKELYGEDYSDYNFHEALMKMGPAQFSVLKKYLPDYYSKAE